MRERPASWWRDASLRHHAELAAIGALVLAFVWIGHEVGQLDHQRLDERILLALRNAPDDPIGPPWVEAIMLNLSALGSGAVIALVAALSVIALVLARHARYALLVGASAGLTAAAMALLKRLYRRPRP